MSKKQKHKYCNFFSTYWFFFILAIILVLLDQLTKYCVSKNITSLPIINNIFHLTLSHNKGVAFGLFAGSAAISVWIAVIVAGVVIYSYDEVKQVLTKIALALVLGGTIGNLIDRISFGYVIDFIDFRIWPIFNIADAALTIGAILIIISYFKYKDEM